MAPEGEGGEGEGEGEGEGDGEAVEGGPQSVAVVWIRAVAKSLSWNKTFVSWWWASGEWGKYEIWNMKYKYIKKNKSKKNKKIKSK